MALLTPRDAVDRLSRVAAAAPHRTVWLGVDGFGASGKSTLALALADALPGAVVVHADDFSSPAVPEWDWRRFVEQVVDPLREGRDARYQRWDWGTDTGAEWYDIAPGAAVVVEGVSSTRAEIDVAWDATVWVEAPESVRLDRALARDGPDLVDTWVTRWMPEERAWLASDDARSRADLRVSGIIDTLTARVCGPGDVETLERMLPVGDADLWRSFAARQDEGVAALLVCWVGSRPIGTALLDWRGPRGSTTHAGVGTLSNLHVEASCRGHGAGAALLAAAECIATDRGHDDLVIGVAVDNPDARRLYLRAGYEATGVVAESRYSWTDADGVVHDAVEQDEVLIKALGRGTGPGRAPTGGLGEWEAP